MLHLGFKIITGSLAEAWRRFQDTLASIGAHRRSAQRLDALGDRLLQMSDKIDRLRAHMGGAGASQPMDRDGSLRGFLKELKQDIREIRCQLASWRTGGANARLMRAVTRLTSIAERTYSLADKLQWEIDEHERTQRRSP
jgi:hypothetical protein